MIRVSLIGYGQMGKLINSLRNKYDFSVISKIDVYNKEADFNSLSPISNQNIDVAIDFSSPKFIIQNIDFYIENNIKAVIGTTGWHQKKDEIEKKIKKYNATILYGSNFSVGMNLFFKIVENTASLYNKLEDYDIWGHELHHKNKIDSPSGTALELANIIMKNTNKKDKININPIQAKIPDDELHFSSTRAGFIPGTHIIGIDSEENSIELKHTARNRNGFAKGAIFAAKWLAKQNPGFYDFKKYFWEIISL